MGERLEQLLAVLNGTVGNYLERADNGLATPFQLLEGQTERARERHAPSTKVVVLIHGLMCTESVFTVEGADGSRWDYGSRLAAELGYRPLYARYNTGRHISDNGASLDRALDQLARDNPDLEEIALLGHSMGGLVIRAACHTASDGGHGSAWLPLVKRAFYLGSPHLGAPLERAGNVVTWVLGKIPNPVTELLADIANLRSDGIKDLRYANLRREDWHGHEADALLTNRRHPVPLLPTIRHHLIAGSVAEHPVSTLLFGDAIVPVRSATGQAKAGDRSAIFPQKHLRFLPGLHHLALAHDAEVYAILRGWFEETIPSSP